MTAYLIADVKVTDDGCGCLHTRLRCTTLCTNTAASTCHAAGT